MILGVATVFFASVLGIAVAFLLVRYDFAGRNLFSYLTMIPIISPPLVGVLGFTFILGRAGTVNVLLMDVFDMLQAGQLPLRAPRGGAGGDAPSLPDDHAQRGGRPRQGGPVARGGGGERGRARLVEALAGHAAPDHAGLRGGRAARLHLDVLRLRHAARAGRAGPPGPAGLSQHRAVRGPAHLPHGHRDLGADGAARDPLPAGRAALRGDQGLLVALLLEDRAAAALARPAGAGHRLPELPAAAVLHPLHRGDAGLGGEGLGADAAAGGLHAPVLRARDRGDAEVHREQLPLLRARGGDLHRGGRAHRVAARAVHRAGARRARRASTR